MKISITKDESMACLTIANATLIMSLMTNGFLESDYYKKMPWSATSIEHVSLVKQFLSERNLDNTSMMLMLLYGLLVLPKEQLGAEYDKLCKADFNSRITQKYKELQTTYTNEDSTRPQTVNFFRHIRNAVSHAKYEFYNDNGSTCVKFMDESHYGEKFSVSMLTGDMGEILDYLQTKLMEFMYNRIQQYQIDESK